MKKTIKCGVCLAILFGAVASEAQTPSFQTQETEYTGEMFSVQAGDAGQKRRSDSMVRDASASDKTIEKDYADFKKRLHHKTGITYSLDVSFLAQRGSPNGKGTPWQTQYYGTANWDMFRSDTFGNGSLQIAYSAVRYWGINAQKITNRIGVISGINDDTTNVNYFNQLSYTHQLPDALSGLSVTIGQFPISDFDGGTYDSNQQINFLNEALSQNASYTYPTDSLGGYVSFSPNGTWSFAAGFQDAHNVSGETISIRKFGKGRFTSFGNITFNPVITGLGAGSYGVTLYHQPSVREQPTHSTGWSFNLQQEIGEKSVVFARLNGASDSTESVKQSYVLGVVYNNPFNRNALDQIGFAGAINKLNTSVNGAGTRSVENVLEAYCSIGVSNFMIITPDVQFYINPGANTKEHTATVASLRATVMF